MIKIFINKLLQIYDDKNHAQQILYWLLEKLLGKTKSELLATNIQLTKGQEEQLNKMVCEHVDDHKPLQYILGSVPFLNVDILVEPPVLIPRPETEWWVDDLLSRLDKEKTYQILDLCSGSGCIAIALAKSLPNSKVIAVDILPQACELIKKNIQHNKLQNVTVVQSDLFNEVQARQSFDIIVANPPYVPQADYKDLDPSVKDWESKLALVAPEDDLSCIAKIIKDSKNYLNFNSQLWLEIDATQGKEVQALMQLSGFNKVVLLKDLANKDRVVIGER